MGFGLGALGLRVFRVLGLEMEGSIGARDLVFKALGPLNPEPCPNLDLPLKAVTPGRSETKIEK